MQINPNSNSNIHTSILYMNDMHAQFPKMAQMKSEADSFETSTKNRKDVDAFVLSGGDTFIGSTKTKNKMAATFLNEAKVEYSAMGNHEVDSIATFEDNLDAVNTKFVVANMSRTGKTPFDKYFDEKKLVSSTIVEKNGHQYGLIGAAPFKLKRSSKLKKANLSVEEYEQTKQALQEEVKKLQGKGINKVIFLSHMGYANDTKLAKEVSGIDIIIGGHSHDLVKGTNHGRNVIVAPDGNPVVITQAGQNGEYIGKLDVIFDSEGKITEATNDVKSTQNSPKSLVIKFFQDRIFGKAEHLGDLTEVENPQGSPKVFENPYADFFADSMRTELGADVAFINSAGIRGNLQQGTLSNMDIRNLIPFENKLSKVEISEKDIIDTLQDGADSVKDKMLKPGIMQVSGLRYEIDKNGKITNVQLQDKHGKFSPIDMKNPSTDKKFTAICDDFLTKSDEYPTLNKCKIITQYDFDKTKPAEDYAKKLDKIKIKRDGRIQNNFNKMTSN